jgi:hypothetical protein
MTTIHQCTDSSKVIRARGRLSNAKKVFADRQWDVLPQGIRGQRILRWSADHAHLADPANPERSVLRWCRKWAPWLKPAELDAIVAYTTTSNKRWSDDESAAVLEINLADRQRLYLRFIGADDDPNYEIREGLQREKDAGYSRTYRAKHRTGRPRGRPKSDGVPAWVAAGASSRATYYRNLKAEKNETENPSGLLSKNRSPDAISVSPVQSVSPAVERGPLQAAPSQSSRPSVIRLDAAPDGFVIDEDGNEYKVPPPYERRPAPKTWMHAAFEGYNGGRS